jgi:hypothetical protein
MDDLLGAPSSRNSPPSDSTTSLFLGLYLLILAFFIVLVSISTTEKVRAKAVMEGLSSTFSSLLPPAEDAETFSSKEGDLMAAGLDFQEQIAGVFATEIQITRVEVVTPGRSMRVVMPAEALFKPGEAALRDTQMPLLDRIVAELSRRTPGMRYEMELALGAPYAIGHDLPIGQTLESTRAGTFGRAMASRGVPPESVSVGLRPSPGKEITLWFLSRPLDEARIRFDLALKPAQPKPPPPAAPAKAGTAPPPPPAATVPAAKVGAPLPPPPAPAAE